MDYMTIKEAIQRTGVNDQTLYKAFRAGKIQGYQATDERNKIYLDRDSVDLFSANTRVKKGVWGNIRIDGDRKFYFLTGYDYRYATTSDGGVINIDLGTELTPFDKNGKGYLAVGLVKGGEIKTEYVHQLVMRSQGHYNNLNKPDIHHINQNPADNKIRNLLAVWPSEHHQLHKLLNDGKKAEYNTLVKEIKAQNRERIYKIPHPDWGERYVMMVTKRGANAYLAGREFPYDSIVSEYELWGGPTKPPNFNFECDFMREGA